MRPATHSSKSKLRRDAFDMRKSWLRSLQNNVDKAYFRRGGVLYKRRKLHRLSSVGCSCSQTEMCQLAADHFSSKYGGKDFSTRERILDFVHSAEGIQLGLMLQAQMVETAFSKIQNNYKENTTFRKI